MPFAESMISVVKSNKNIMLNKSRHFRKTKSIYKHAEKPEYNLPNATPQILSEIKERLERERKLRILKITVFILLVSILTIILISYL